MKKPSLQFYPGDWRKDPSVNCLSLAARGLWFEMLMLMHESPRRGYLTMTPQQIARAVGATLSETKQRLKELESANTFSMDEAGVIFNRRMVRDDEVSKVRSVVGKKGAENRWQSDGKYNGKFESLPLPIEGEDEVEVKNKKLPEVDFLEIFDSIESLYFAAGVPVPPKHKQLCLQLFISIPAEKRPRVLGYVKHMLDSGRWSSAAKTKGLKNLLLDGDWDVPIVERTIPVPNTQSTGKRDIVAEMLAEERAKYA